MAGEAVASPMRLATAPGRSARPAPPGNDDPCEERRTIPEGLPRLPREAFARGLRRVALNPPKPLAKEDRQRRARARARNPTWSAVKASVSIAGNAGRLTAHRMSGLPDMRQMKSRACWPDVRHIDRGQGQPGVRNERKAGSARACRSMRRPHAGHGVLDTGALAGIRGANGAPLLLARGRRKTEVEASSE
jgi:hypothetical protein